MTVWNILRELDSEQVDHVAGIVNRQSKCVKYISKAFLKTVVTKYLAYGERKRKYRRHN